MPKICFGHLTECDKILLLQKLIFSSNPKAVLVWDTVLGMGRRAAAAWVQNHRIVGVGRDLCGSSSPTLLPKQGHPEQAAQDLVQAGLEYLQRRRLHSLPGQPVPGLHHPPNVKEEPKLPCSLGAFGWLHVTCVCLRFLRFEARMKQLASPSSLWAASRCCRLGVGEDRVWGRGPGACGFAGQETL